MYLEGVFYTSDYVMHGFVDTTQERLSDYLNVKDETTIVVYEAKVSRLLSLGKSQVMSIPEARIEKNSILLSIPVELKKAQTSFYRRANRVVCPVRIFLPNFMLVGSIHLVEKFEIHRVLLSRAEDFIPITEVTAIYTFNPGAPIRNNIMVFNKNRMVMIGENNEEDVPPAGAGAPAENTGADPKRA